MSAILKVASALAFVLMFTHTAFSQIGWASMNGGTTGGAGGTTVTVTTASQLTDALNSTAPMIIRVSGTISGDFIMETPNKTLEGAAAGAGINGTIGIHNTRNIIVRNLVLRPTEERGLGDVIEISTSTNVWVTNCDISDHRRNLPDGLIDIVRASDFVTIAWNRLWFPDPSVANRRGMLIGNSDDRTTDRGTLRITIHHNWFDRNIHSRAPRVRFGRIHIFNNYYSMAGNDYCIGPGLEAQVLVESNFFENVADPHIFFNFPETAVIGVNNDNHYVNTTGLRESGGGTIFTPPYQYTLNRGADVKAIVMAGVGPQFGGVQPPPPPPPPPAAATITRTPTSLSFGTVVVGQTATLSYTLSAANLTPASGNITVTAPAGFAVSLTETGTYTTSVTVAYSAGALASRTIWVRFSPTAAQAFSGNVTNTGGGAPAVNVAVSGTGQAPPPPPPPAAATITRTPTSLSFGTVVVGQTATLSYTLSAANLTPASGNITVTAPAGFAVSLTETGTYTTSVTVAYTAGALATRTIWVRFSPTAAQAFSGNVTNTGGGAPAVTVAVTGTGQAPPPPPPPAVTRVFRGNGNLFDSLFVYETANAQSWSVMTNLAIGQTVYGDRAFTIEAIPQGLAGAEWIQTAMNSRTNSTLSQYATLIARESGVLYIAHSDRVTTKPQWLSTFTQTDMVITIRESATVTRTLTVFSRPFAQGERIALGINSNDGTTTSNMYIPILMGEPVTNIAETVSEVTELAISVSPNPFNPVATISYSLPSASFVELRVFNINGALVEELVKDSKNAGVHTVSFDGSRLPSGVYFARMSVNGRVLQKKMILLK